MSKDTDITTFERPFWVRPPWTVLFDLIKLHKIQQPWNINLFHLLTTLMNEMKEKGYIDFSASGVALLSSAVIYRMKSELILELQEPPQSPPQKPIEVLPPPIQLPYRFEYTSTKIEDLIMAFDELLKDRSYLESLPKPAPITSEPLEILELDDFMINIETKIKSMYNRILKLYKKNNIIKFSDLIKGFKKLDSIRSFLLILFLACDDKIHLRQDDDFGEIYISLPLEREKLY